MVVQLEASPDSEDQIYYSQFIQGQLQSMIGVLSVSGQSIDVRLAGRSSWR